MMKKLVILSCLFCLLFTGVSAQGMGGGTSRIEGKAKFIPVPFVNYSRSIGFMMGALPMVQFNPVMSDTLSPSSTVGLMGFYSTNETWMALAFGRFYFDEDNWRIKTVVGTGNFNFQTYVEVSDLWIPYNNDTFFAIFGIQRKIVNNIYGGVSFKHSDALIMSEASPEAQESKLNGIGLDFSADLRDNVYYPRSGFFTELKYFSFPSFLDNEYESDMIEMEYNHYISARDNNDVFAGRLFTGLGIGELAFDQQFIVGHKDVRGYTQGAFRGNYLVALQGEYRWNPLKRLGFVGFAGLATIFESPNENDNGRLLPGAGAGFRYVVSKDTNFKVGVDIAAGDDDWGLYFRVGEAF